MKVKTEDIDRRRGWLTFLLNCIFSVHLGDEPLFQ